MIRDLLKGTGVALVTPFAPDLSVDYAALERVINFVIDDGVQYVVSLGTTGETATLTKEEKLNIFNFTCEKVQGRVPVVIGIGGNSTREVLHDLDVFPLENAVAILSVSPYYNKPSQEGIYQHYRAIAQATTKPIILYNVPGRTGSNILPATAIRLANDFENINGMKEASGDVVQCMHLLKEKPRDFFVTSGDDHLALPLIACGMNGVISVAANCFPKDVSELVMAAINNDYQLARTLQLNLLEGFDLLFAENNPAGVKAFLSELGLIENYLRPPLASLSTAYAERVKRYLPTLK
jgi:4-hydroxy-tetrahydrodipicolinate synthase